MDNTIPIRIDTLKNNRIERFETSITVRCDCGSLLQGTFDNPCGVLPEDRSIIVGACYDCRQASYDDGVENGEVYENEDIHDRLESIADDLNSEIDNLNADTDPDTIKALASIVYRIKNV